MLLIAAYLLLGRHVLLTAVKNIGRGQVFDENFLMAVATIGAWAVGSFDEAVGVMLFYRVGEYFEDRAVDRSRKQIMDAIDLRPGDGKSGQGQRQNRSYSPPRTHRRATLFWYARATAFRWTARLSKAKAVWIPRLLPVSRFRSVSLPATRQPSGCVNTDGAIKLRVTHILAESMVQRILDSVENAAARKPKIDRFITRFSRVYTPAVVAIALLTAIIPSLVTGEWHSGVYTAMTFLVISCPCALVLSVPLTYFSGIGAGSRRGILFKGGASLEALNNVKTIVMDKTGTITKGQLRGTEGRSGAGRSAPMRMSFCGWLPPVRALPPTRSPSPSSTPTRSAKRPRQRPATFLLLPLVQRLRTSASRPAKAFSRRA